MPLMPDGRDGGDKNEGGFGVRPRFRAGTLLGAVVLVGRRVALVDVPAGARVLVPTPLGPLTARAPVGLAVFGPGSLLGPGTALPVLEPAAGLLAVRTASPGAGLAAVVLLGVPVVASGSILVPTAALVAFASLVTTVLRLSLVGLTPALLAAPMAGAALLPAAFAALLTPLLARIATSRLTGSTPALAAMRVLLVPAPLPITNVASSVAPTALLAALRLLSELLVSPAAAFLSTGFAPVLEGAPFAGVRFEAAALILPLALLFGSSILPPVGLPLGSRPFVPVRLPPSSLAAIAPVTGLLSPVLLRAALTVAFRSSSLPSAVVRPLCAAVPASAAAEQPVEPAPVAALAVAVPSAAVPCSSVGFARAFGTLLVAVSVGGVSVVHGVVVGGRRFGPIDAPVAGGLGTAVEVGRTHP